MPKLTRLATLGNIIRSDCLHDPDCLEKSFRFVGDMLGLPRGEVDALLRRREGAARTNNTSAANWTWESALDMLDNRPADELPGYKLAAARPRRNVLLAGC